MTTIYECQNCKRCYSHRGVIVDPVEEMVKIKKCFTCKDQEEFGRKEDGKRV